MRSAGIGEIVWTPGPFLTVGAFEKSRIFIEPMSMGASAPELISIPAIADWSVAPAMALWSIPAIC